MSEQIGFIGLGIMGCPMAGHLVKAGFSVLGYEIVEANQKKAAALGVKKAASIAEVAANCSIIINMLPTPAICVDVAIGADGIANYAKAGSLVIDMSSISPLTAKEICDGLAKKQIAMLDAPVSGGEPKAVDGTLAIMVGGNQKDYDRALPLFKAMGSSSLLVGDIGAGCIAKLANQIIVGVNIAAMSEALTMAAKAGVKPELVFEAIRGGLAGSTVLEAKAPMVLDRNYKAGGRIDIHTKDFVNVLSTSHSINAPTPLTALVMEMFQSLKAHNLGEIDHCGLIRFYEMIAGVEVKRTT